MVPEILNGWLWQVRLAIRTGGARAFAAHGYVDPSYRPPRLPFVSVVGPMALHVEPDRENGKAGVAKIRTPGYAIGQVRGDSSTVPATGQLAIRFDGRALITLAVAGFPATAFGDPATGPAVAAAINAALVAAVAANQVTDVTTGQPLTDPVLLAALATLAPGAVRWSQSAKQLAITSTPGTDTTGQRSSIELLPVANDLTPALGFAPPFARSDGRQKLHKLPAPRPLTVETRLDLWAHSQLDMALMFDGLANMAPTRGRLLLRPSLLAVDCTDGATTLQLLDRGEPTTPDSLVHLEGGDGLTDRVHALPYTATAGAVADPANSRFSLSAAGQIRGLARVTPLIPDALFSTAAAPAGFAVALGVQLDAAAAAGESYQLFAIETTPAPPTAPATLASIALTVVATVLPSGDPATFGEVTATAQLVRGGVTSSATTVWRIPLASLVAGGTLHATVTGDTGGISLAWEGDAQRTDDPVTSPVAPVLVPGSAPALGADLTLALGGGAGAPLPRPVLVTHLHVFSEPYGPLDPKLRTSVAGASRLRPGDQIAIATSSDGWHLGETKSLALVDSVSGSTVALTRPIVGAFHRARAIVYQDECFYFQTAVKRRDDLMNRLYHTSVDYRVSALLEDPNARASTTLVLEHQENLSPHGAPRAPGGHPGVTATDADPVRGVN